MPSSRFPQLTVEFFQVSLVFGQSYNKATAWSGVGPPAWSKRYAFAVATTTHPPTYRQTAATIGKFNFRCAL